MNSLSSDLVDNVHRLNVRAFLADAALVGPGNILMSFKGKKIVTCVIVLVIHILTLQSFLITKGSCLYLLNALYHYFSLLLEQPWGSQLGQNSHYFEHCRNTKPSVFLGSTFCITLAFKIGQKVHSPISIYLFVAAMNNKCKSKVQPWPVDSHGVATPLSAGGEVRVTF